MIPVNPLTPEEPDVAVSCADILSAIRRWRYRPAGEAELQEAIGQALAAACIAFEREVPLSAADRIDFLVGSIGLELKVDGGPAAVMRQLQRYALSERISELVLVTTRSQMARVPSSLAGKGIHVVVLRVGLQ